MSRRARAPRPQVRVRVLQPFGAALVRGSSPALCRSQLKRMKLPPGELGWPFGGLDMFENDAAKFRTVLDFHDAPMRKARLFGKPNVLVRQLEHIKVLLGADGDMTQGAWEVRGPGCRRRA